MTLHQLCYATEEGSSGYVEVYCNRNTMIDDD